GAGHGLGEPGREHSVAADVDGLSSDLRDAAHDHIVDEAGIQIVAFCQGLEGFGSQVHRMPAGQASVPLPSRGAYGVNNHGAGRGPDAPWVASLAWSFPGGQTATVPRRAAI